MRERLEERRALFEAILADPAASHNSRLKADERLAELELSQQRRASVETLTPEQALAEIESLAGAMPGILSCARVAAGADPLDVIEPPVEAADLPETIDPPS
jgi:hypothetical protein